MEDNDAQLQLKKRARRRLVGAVFFASVVAIVLPLIMDQEPRQPVQDVEIRIPGQDDKAFVPKFAAAPIEVPPAETAVAEPARAKPLPAPAVAPRSPEPAWDKPQDKPAARPEKPADKPLEKRAEKAAEKVADKAVEKSADRAAEKPKATDDKSRPKAEDARRAAAILAGQAAESRPRAPGGEYLVLIGAFSSEANVKTLRTKLGELGIRVFTEPLDTPQGHKTRVRAGPFPSRDAADKALEKMHRIGVAGVVSAKP